MKALRILVACIFALLHPLILLSQSAIISGTVRDAEGRLVAGARVTLTNQKSTTVTVQTRSNESGEYRFAGIAIGEYSIAAELNGSEAKPAEIIKISSASQSRVIDLTLGAGAAKPTPKFEAAGIRGLIDPGGYSAAANAAAASGLIAGIADINRTGKGASAAKDWPCNLEAELAKAAQANPASAEANRRLGEFYLAHDQASRALPFLQKSHQIDGADYASSRDLAAAWIKTGQFNSARELLTTMAERQSKPEVHQLLARALEGLGQFSQAAQQYQIAAREDPSEENLFGMGYELILAGSVADAAKAFQLALERYPRSTTLLLGAGSAAFLQGNAPEGVSYFLRAADLEPTDPRAYAFLSSASETSPADSVKIRASFKRFYELAPDNARACFYYALSLRNQGGANSTDEGLKVEELLKRAILLDPQFAKAHYQLGILYASRGDYAGAVKEYEAALRLDPALNEAHYRLSIAYSRTKHPDLAEHEMKIFRGSQAPAETGMGGGMPEVDIRQFFSVFDQPGQESSPGVQCPAIAR
jgi:tetratricopeptide (TPR) repeat protein